MNGDIPAEKRAQWREWARQEFGDDERAVELATEFVLDSLVAGNSVDESMAIARAGACGQVPTATGSEPRKGQTDPTLGEPEYPISDPKHLRGRVSLFRSRNELMGNQYGTVWNFRVDSWNQEGKLQEAIAVEMRGLRFSG